MAQSFLRRLKRDAMRRAGLTYSQRVRKAVASGKKVSNLRFEVPEGTKTVVAMEVS